MRKLYISLFLTLFVLPVFVAHAQEVNLIWQADTYSHPFYLGKGLWTSQSNIKLVAIPKGLGNPAILNYKWTKNGTVLGNLSGIGKNTLTYTDTILSLPQNFKVEVVTAQNTVLARAILDITPVSPILAVYEDNPLYGFLFNKEVSDTYKLADKEATFAAFPMFFSVSSRADSSLSYNWKSNAGEDSTTNSVTYRAPDNVSGTSQISVNVASSRYILQSANKNFLLEFGNAFNTGL